MKSFRIFAVSAAIVAAMVFAGAPVRAQMSSTPPIVVKQNPPKQVWLKALVIHADNNSLMVRDEKNQLNIYTFTYTPKVRDEMQKLLDRGGYQTGDRVRILHQVGETIALAVRGKPSKPI